MNGNIISIKDAALGIKEIKIKIDSKIRFLNGQYLMIAFPEDSRDRRSYSILEYNEELDMVVVLIKEAGVFTKRIHDSVIGQRLLVFGPYGKFILKNSSKNVFIAGGIGIVPLYSMLNKLISGNNKNYSTYFFYTSRYEREMILIDELKKIKNSESSSDFNLNIKLYFTREGNMDRLDIEDIKKIPEFKEYNYYICGPEVMMNYFIDNLKNIGIDTKTIFTESFVLEKI